MNAKNQGTDTAAVVFIFSAPGFEDYMRCESVLPNEKPAPISPQKDKECEERGHVIYKVLEENPKKIKTWQFERVAVAVLMTPGKCPKDHPLSFCRWDRLSR